MKKIIYLICSGLIAFTSCDPMEDVYAELDAQRTPAVYKSDLVLTMAPADYTALKGKAGVPDRVALTQSFATDPEAAAIIPLYIEAYLKAKPLQLDNGSNAKVTYNVLVYDFTNNTVAGLPAPQPLPVYTLVDEDYAGAGTTYKNLNISNNDAEVIRWLNYKYPTPVENQLAVFTFNAYNSRVSSSSPATTDSYYYKNGAWVNAYHVSAEDYTSVNRGRYKNFEGIDDDLLPAYFNKFLSNAFIAPQFGAVQHVSYNYRAGSNQQRIMTMFFNGSAWVEVKQDITRPATINFAKINGEWKPDLTIKYTLAEADYMWIGDDANGIGTADNRANLRSFKNFYQQSETDSRAWTDAQIQAGLAARLKVLYPDAEAGQKYLVTYVYYNSGAKNKEITFVKEASGNYVVFKG